METQLTFAPKVAAATPPLAPELQPPSDKKVPVVKALDGSTTLPAERPFVAQVVTARLSGTAFPDNPSDIAPPERTLRPYGTPMLPSEKLPEPEEVTQDAATVDEQQPADENDTLETPAIETPDDNAEPRSEEQRSTVEVPLPDFADS